MAERTARMSYAPGAMAITLALLLMLATGVIGVGRAGVAFDDVRYWYVAAHAFVQGLDPYDVDVFRQLCASMGLGPIERFPYPAHGFGFAALFSFLPYGVARWIFSAASTGALLLLARWVYLRAFAAGHSPRNAMLFAALLIASPSVSNVLWTGQVALIFGACLLFGWEAAHRGRYLLAGFLLAFASIKPQLSIFPLLWLLFERQWRTLMVTAIIAALMAIPPLIHFSPEFLITGWLRSVSEYQLEPSKWLGTTYNTTASSLIRGIGLQAPGTAAWAIAGSALTAIGFVLLRRWPLSGDTASAGTGARPEVVRALRVAVLLALVGLGLLLVSGRDYDLAAVLPLALACAAWAPRPSQRVLLLVLLASLFIPHRVMEMSGIPLLLYWRIPVLLAIVLAVLPIARGLLEHGVASRHARVSRPAFGRRRSPNERGATDVPA